MDLPLYGNTHVSYPFHDHKPKGRCAYGVRQSLAFGVGGERGGLASGGGWDGRENAIDGDGRRSHDDPSWGERTSEQVEVVVATVIVNLLCEAIARR